MTPRVHRRLASSVVLAICALATRTGRADDVRWLDLAWQAPAECPPGSEIEREIARLVGASPRVKGTLRAIVDVTGSDEQAWRARVRTDYGGEVGERTLEGATCRAVAKAAALVISLMVDSSAGKVEPAPARPPAPAPQPTPPARKEPEPPPPPPPVAIEPARGTPVRGFVAFGPRSELGLFENPGFGFELALGARVPAGSLELAAAAYLPENITAARTAAGGRFSLRSLAGRACPRVMSGDVELFACAGASFDRLSAQGFGVTNPGSAATNLITLSLGPGLDFVVTRSVRLTFGIEAAYTPGRAHFVLENVGPVHTAASLGGSARLQLVWYL
jgi:hypothetical protein